MTQGRPEPCSGNSRLRQGYETHRDINAIDPLSKGVDRLEQEAAQALALEGRPHQHLAQPQPLPVWPGVVVVDCAEAHLRARHRAL